MDRLQPVASKVSKLHSSTQASWPLVCGLVLSYIAFKLFFSWALINDQVEIVYTSILAGTLLIVSPFMRQPRVTKAVYAVFGFSLFFFGHKPNEIQSIFFEFVLCGLILLTLLSSRSILGRLNPIGILLTGFVFISVCSLFMLPWHSLTEFLNPRTAAPILYIAETATSHSYLFGTKGVIRLILFSIFVLVLVTRVHGLEYLEMLVKGLVIGAIISCAIGVLDYYQLLNLDNFRNLDPLVNQGGQSRLQSVFGHPGWFAEFITVSIPYILYGFIHQNHRSQKYLLLAALVLCEIGLILAQARSGWIVYPLTLMFCWIFFYYLNGETSKRIQVSWRKTFAVLLSVPLTILVSVIVVAGANNLGEKTVSKETQQLTDRAKRVLQLSDRTTPWMDGINVGLESPWVGVGYQAYRVHANILEWTPDTILRTSQIDRKKRNTYPTEHNFYITTFVSVGLIGLLLWGLLCFQTALVLVKDTIVNKAPENIPYLLSLISFHIYGLAQSMQYIPVVWFLVFLPFARAIFVSREVNAKTSMAKVSVLACSVYLILSAQNFNSRNLQQKYDLDDYWAITSHKVNYQKTLGMHQSETWPQGQFAWTGRHAIIKDIPAGLYSARIHTSHPDIKETHLEVRMTSPDGRTVSNTLDRPGFHDLGIAVTEMDAPFLISVSRTFQPSDYGSKDTRSLGIALGELVPVDAIGTYGLEGVPPNQFRWSRNTAYLDLSDRANLDLVMWVHHPNLDQNPVTVRLTNEHNQLIHELSFSSTIPTSVPVNSLGARFLRISVDKTWKPSEVSSSTDDRDLGVALQFRES